MPWGSSIINNASINRESVTVHFKIQLAESSCTTAFVGHPSETGYIWRTPDCQLTP